jgi:hypothetical protein
VRAQAALGSVTANGATIGTASYISSGTTGTNGVAALSFLPGSGSTSTNASIAYGVTATPPVGSVYGSSCAKNVTPLAGGGSGSTLATIMPGFRPTLTGIISTADGYRVSNVTVTASGTPDPLDPACPAPAAVTANTTTDANGMFGLPLDAGTYQLDYDPLAGSSAPRWTEPSVQVSLSPMNQTHNVMLPAGARVTGQVVGKADGLPVGSATIRFFQQRCTTQTQCFGSARIAPGLVGKALTDSNGNFRMVIPAPLPQ